MQHAQWPEHLLELSERIRDRSRAELRHDFLQEFWVVLNAVLLRLLRSHAGRSRCLSDEDLRDLASQKALELMQRVVSQEWNLRGRSPGELVRYLTRVVDNTIADELRRARRRRELGDETPERTSTESTEAGPGSDMEAKLFAKNLVTCLEEIQPRARRIWFLRAFYGLSSKEIAHHPDVMVEPGHVDVILMRARRTLQDCLERRGQTPTEMPPGTYVAVWRRLHRERIDAGIPPIDSQARVPEPDAGLRE